jgi:hypothetical protein
VKIYDKKGSALVLVIIIISVVTSMAVSLLSITLTQLQIKKSYGEVIKAFYLSEDGLNSTYLKIYNLIYRASDDSLEKAGDYLKMYPDDLIGASNTFEKNYKLYIESNAAGCVKSTGNPLIEVLNSGRIVFIDDRLTLRVRSKYENKSKVEKYTAVDIIILIPGYLDTKSGNTDFTGFLHFENFQT